MAGRQVKLREDASTASQTRAASRHAEQGGPSLGKAQCDMLARCRYMALLTFRHLTARPCICSSEVHRSELGASSAQVQACSSSKTSPAQLHAWYICPTDAASLMQSAPQCKLGGKVLQHALHTPARLDAAMQHSHIASHDSRCCHGCRCDTFFLASCVMDEAQLAPGGSKGCDISHRGGAPGFIQVQESGVLTWADYIGNMTFTTLGACLRRGPSWG